MTAFQENSDPFNSAVIFEHPVCEKREEGRERLSLNGSHKSVLARVLICHTKIDSNSAHEIDAKKH